jgi:hypothetical protein
LSLWSCSTDGTTCAAGVITIHIIGVNLVELTYQMALSQRKGTTVEVVIRMPRGSWRSVNFWPDARNLFHVAVLITPSTHGASTVTKINRGTINRKAQSM